MMVIPLSFETADYTTESSHAVDFVLGALDFVFRAVNFVL